MNSVKSNKPKNISTINMQQEYTSIHYAEQYYKFLFDREKTRMSMKKQFFTSILCIYILLISFSCVLFIVAIFISKDSSLVVVIGSVLNLISTNIALPLIIAKNLFQATENDNLQLFFDNYVKGIKLSQQLEEKSSLYTNSINEKMDAMQKENIIKESKVPSGITMIRKRKNF